MNKSIAALVLVASLGLVACDASTENVTTRFDLPSDLQECELIRLSPDGGSSDRVYILKCPEGYTGTTTVGPKGYVGTTAIVSSGSHPAQGHKANTLIITEE